MVKQQVEKSPKAKRINRPAAAISAVVNMAAQTTLAELAQEADDVFVKGGGKSNVKLATHDVRRVLEAAEALGAVKLTRPRDVLVERVAKQ